jgi:hypothetical protein
MNEISIEKAEELANEWYNNSKKWHFHMLTPDCVFNERDDKQAFVLENISDKEVYVVYSDKRYMGVGQRLVKLIHGDKILAEETDSISNDIMKTIIEKAKSLNEKDVHWHHHMLFPDCKYNKHKGKWNIVFEDQETGNVLEALYDHEPVSDLRAVEVLYYAQKE